MLHKKLDGAMPNVASYNANAVKMAINYSIFVIHTRNMVSTSSSVFVMPLKRSYDLMKD